MDTATVEQLARLVAGETLGDGAREIRGVAPLTKAGPDELTFAVGEKHLRRLKTARAGACLVSKGECGNFDRSLVSTALIAVDDPLDAFAIIVERFRPRPERPQVGVHARAEISPTAVVGPDCNVYPGAFIDEGAVVGARCDVYPGVFIGRNCRIGDDCTLYPRVVLYPEVVLGSAMPNRMVAW